MFKIKNTWIPPNGYHCITLWPFLFYKGELLPSDVRHENVHQRQYLWCVAFGSIPLIVKLIFFSQWILWPFIVFPFVLFYIIWIFGLITKGYAGIKWEIAAYKEEREHYLEDNK